MWYILRRTDRSITITRITNECMNKEELEYILSDWDGTTDEFWHEGDRYYASELLSDLEGL